MSRDIVEFNSYKEFTDSVWLPTSSEDNSLSIEALGLVGEAAEVSEKVKKYLHYGRPVDREAIAKELGDVLFYWTRIAKRFGLNAEEIVWMNIDKLESRKARGTTNGEGSNR